MANVLQFRKNETFYINGKSHRGYKGVRNKFLTELEKLTTTHDYDESTPINNRSWIDTNFIPNKNNDIDIKITFAIPAASSGKRTIVLGNWLDNSLGSIGIETDTAGKIRLYIDGGTINNFTTEVYPVDTPILVHYHYDATTPLHTLTAQTLDGSVTSILNITNKNWSLRSQTYPMLMGKDHRPLAAYLNSFAGITIYQCEITNSDKHLKFVPYITRSNKVAMYDVINQEWHYNKGNVDLIAGRQVKEVEYIDIPTETYFNTLFKPNTTTTTIRTRLTPLALSNGAWIFGSRNSTTIDNSTCCLYQLAAGYRLDWANGYQNGKTYTCDIVPALNEPITLEMTRDYAKLNDSVFTFTEGNSIDINYQFLIGKANCGGKLDVSGDASFRLNFVELLNTATREDYRYFIPAKDENNVGFLFDKVTHTIFDPIGGDISGYGKEIHYVDYIESTGTQYIDTGIKMNANMGLEILIKQTGTQTGKSRYFYGNYDSNNVEMYMLAVRSGNSKYILSINNKYVECLNGYDGNFHTHKVLNKEYFIDGASYGTITVNDFTAENTSYLFQIRNMAFGWDTWQIKNAIITDENGVMVRNFVPSMDETLEGMMLDKVWHNLYLNGGTGEFVTNNQIIRE